jgi:hypothetical protein
MLEIIKAGDFAGGVMVKGEFCVTGRHSKPVVDNLNQSPSSFLYGNQYAKSSGIERILNQFFYDGSGSLDHFAGSDLVGQYLGKDLYFRQKSYTFFRLRFNSLS